MADNFARIQVEVPADAEVWMGQVKSSQTGTLRYFMTQALSDQDGTFDVRARWEEGGRLVEQVRRIMLRAGDRLSINFLPPGAPAVPSTAR